MVLSAFCGILFRLVAMPRDESVEITSRIDTGCCLLVSCLSVPV